MNVAVLVPVCSRAHSWTSLSESFLMSRFLPAFEATKDPSVLYTIYIGVDNDDTFFLAHIDELAQIGTVVILSGCQHAPAFAWNQLARVAYDNGHEYLFQIGDDVVIETPGWTKKFIEKLQSHKNRGVVGPVNPVNFALRVGGTQVIENAFVHRSHCALFGSFFHPSIRNWHCDEWLTQIYIGTCSHTFEDIKVSNGCIDKRYNIESVNVSGQIAEGRKKIRQDLSGCFSFCLYGPYTDKYYRGLSENVVILREFYPKCAIHVYASAEASAFVAGLGEDIKLTTTPETGPRNMTYRFLPALTDEYEFVCVRDTDSRIHARDRWCIDTFLDGPTRGYTIRDHKWHAYLIMGGLWGVKGKIPVSPEQLLNFVKARPDGYARDAEVLNTYVYPVLRDSFVVFSHVENGVLCDTSEKVKIIGYPVVNQEFCGNVVLYRDSVPYHEFTQV